MTFLKKPESIKCPIIVTMVMGTAFLVLYFLVIYPSQCREHEREHQDDNKTTSINVTNFPRDSVTTDLNLVETNDAIAPKKKLICLENATHFNGYCIRYYVLTSNQMVRRDNSVTLTTQGTIEDLKHLEELCQRWQGPISVAIYTPGHDYYEVLRKVKMMTLDTDNSCISKWVDLHIFYDVKYKPEVDQVLPQSNESYFLMNQLAFPINFGRNIARNLVYTDYVLPVNIDMYPSVDIIPGFISMIKRHYKEFKNQKLVFMVPLFSLYPNTTMPLNKSQLLQQCRVGKAVDYVNFICESECNNNTYLKRWLRAKSVNDSHNTLDVFPLSSVENRISKHGFYQPFFIGKNVEIPAFDEDKTFNGFFDNTRVIMEMCVKDFKMHLLDNAFLVQYPGTKYDAEVLPHFDRVPENYFHRLKKLGDKYANNSCYTTVDK